jgi:hypothetical protein
MVELPEELQGAAQVSASPLELAEPGPGQAAAAVRIRSRLGVAGALGGGDRDPIALGQLAPAAEQVKGVEQQHRQLPGLIIQAGAHRQRERRHHGLVLGLEPGRGRPARAEPLRHHPRPAPHQREPQFPGLEHLTGGMGGVQVVVNDPGSRGQDRSPVTPGVRLLGGVFADQVMEAEPAAGLLIEKMRAGQLAER